MSVRAPGVMTGGLRTNRPDARPHSRQTQAIRHSECPPICLHRAWTQHRSLPMPDHSCAARLPVSTRGRRLGAPAVIRCRHDVVASQFDARALDGSGVGAIG